jgi:hypothetical protein
VNVYLVDRAYGGPEEGGWWYDTGELLRVFPVERKYADALRDEIAKRDEFSNEGRRPISSVASTGQYRVTVSDEPGESYPTTTPHYE